MKSTIEKQQDGTIILTIPLPAADVQKTWESVVKEYAGNAKIAGFRPGKAPQKVVEEQLDKDKVREEVLRKLLPAAYVEAVQEHKINPIMNPKIHVEKLEDGNDWVFQAHTCEAPEIKLGEYKKNIQKVTAKSKIIVPGQEKKEPNFDEIVKALLDGVTMDIPRILIDQEVDRLLSQTLSEIKSLGLTLDQYLTSTNRNPDKLREEYAEKAATDMKLEFALGEIANKEKITVEQKEVDEAIQKAKSPEERAHLESNKYLLANIIRQQKTIDFIKSL